MKRIARSPQFLAQRRDRGVQPLFSDVSAEPAGLFGDHLGLGLDEAPGVESLAPPLPAPPPPLSAEAAERLGHAIAELRRHSNTLGAQAAADAIEIGCLVARRILEAELETDPQALRALVRSAVRRLGEAQRVTVRLSPADVDAVQAAAAGGEAPLGGVGIAEVEIVADTNLTPGDCFVESDAATVDGRLGTRLEEIRRVLLGAANETDGGESS